MLVRGVCVFDIETAAETAGVRLEHMRPANQRGTAWRLTLRTLGRPPRWGRYGFVRNRRTGNRRRCPGIVCWHGHREFMRALLTRCPGATITTGIIRYRGLADFERTHDATGDRNIGAPVDPLALRDACDCEDEDRASRSLVYAERIVTPEDTLARANEDAEDDEADAPDVIGPARWAEYNRKFCALLAGRAEESTHVH